MYTVLMAEVPQGLEGLIIGDVRPRRTVEFELDTIVGNTFVAKIGIPRFVVPPPGRSTDHIVQPDALANDQY